MSTEVIVKKFDGGIAEDVRTTAQDQAETMGNFDISSNPHLLSPYLDSVSETVTGQTITDYQLSGIAYARSSGNNYIVALGNLSSVSANPTFFYKTTISAGFTIGGNGTGNVMDGSLVVYKNEAYALGFSGSTWTLWKWTAPNTATSIGTISYSFTGSVIVPRPFVHPEDNVLYIIIGNTISTYDGSSLTTYSSILPTGFIGTSLTNYGAYLAIGCQAIITPDTTRAYLWGRDGTINTLQGIVDFGEGNLIAVENIGNVLCGLTISGNSVSSSIRSRLELKTYSGGAVETVKSVELSTSIGGTYKKARYRDKCYFGLSSDDSVWVFGKNKEGRWFLGKDRFILNGSTIGTSIIGIQFLDDYMYIGFASVSQSGQFRRTDTGYTSTSYYRTTTNPNMTDLDREKKKQLVNVAVAYTGGSGAGTVALKYNPDSTGLVSIISQATTANEENVIEATKEADEDPFNEAWEYKFQVETTGGVKIKEIRYKYDKLQTQN